MSCFLEIHEPHSRQTLEKILFDSQPKAITYFAIKCLQRIGARLPKVQARMYTNNPLYDYIILTHGDGLDVSQTAKRKDGSLVRISNVHGYVPPAEETDHD